MPKMGRDCDPGRQMGEAQESSRERLLHFISEAQRKSVFSQHAGTAVTVI